MISDLGATILATAIGMITIALILTRPGRLPEPAAAVIGAGVMLCQRGLDVSPRAYARVGLLLTSPALLATLFVPALTG